MYNMPMFHGAMNCGRSNQRQSTRPRKKSPPPPPPPPRKELSTEDIVSAMDKIAYALEHDFLVDDKPCAKTLGGDLTII